MKRVQPSLAALLLSGATLAHAVPSYTVTPIAPAGSYAQDINNAGAVVGYSGAQSGFIYQHGGYSTHSVPGAESTAFGAINNSGTVLGDTRVPPGVNNALRYANGSFTLYPPPAGYHAIRLSAINDAGVMAGNYNGAASHAFIDNGSGAQLLAPQAGGSIAYEINNSGKVAGAVDTGSGSGYKAAEFANGGYSLIGNFAGSSGAFAINDSGWVGGYYTISSLLGGAFLRDAQGTMTLYSLPNRELFLNDVNNSGLAVGTGWASGSPDSWAYLFDGAAAVDLNTRLVNGNDWTIVAASAINEHGQIAGTGCHQSTGLCQAVLLEVSPVPEPASWAMLLAGLAVAGYGARRRANTGA